jgi:hypothetical protein
VMAALLKAVPVEGGAFFSPSKRPIATLELDGEACRWLTAVERRSASLVVKRRRMDTAIFIVDRVLPAGRERLAFCASSRKFLTSDSDRVIARVSIR